MTLYPLQPFGIGDIIFTQTIIDRFIEAGYEKVVWGVYPQFVEGLNRAYPHITFVDWKKLPIQVDQRRQDQYQIPDGLVIPIRHNVEIMQVPYYKCMESKYSMYGMEYNIWKEKAMWIRDKKREQELVKLTGVKVNGPFALINETYASDNHGRVAIKLKTDLPITRMENIKGFSLFDWALLLEKATEIHTVSTAILYMLELLNLEAKEVHLYPRLPEEKDFKNVEYLFTKPYILH